MAGHKTSATQVPLFCLGSVSQSAYFKSTEARRGAESVQLNGSGYSTRRYQCMRTAARGPDTGISTQYFLNLTVIDPFCESSREDIPGAVRGVLSPDDSMDRVIHKRPKRGVTGKNKLIEPEMPNESGVAEPEHCPIRILRVRQEGENNARLSKEKQIREL